MSCHVTCLHSAVKVLACDVMKMAQTLSALRLVSSKCPAGSRSGQAAIEYVVGAVVLVGAVAILAVFLYTYREHGVRVLDLVASEYP